MKRIVYADSRAKPNMRVSVRGNEEREEREKKKERKKERIPSSKQVICGAMCSSGQTPMAGQSDDAPACQAVHLSPQRCVTCEARVYARESV